MAEGMSIDKELSAASAFASQGRSDRSSKSHSNDHHHHLDDHSDGESLESISEKDHLSGGLGASNGGPQDGQQPPKRKGGRKPIYATSEERKQRNRQAQAAFRERRTEYIKQLEDTIQVHETNLHSLQNAHRSAADECLMLRYKNSLLERILLEKGIDVQAELQAKTGSPNLGATYMPQNLVQPPPIQRAIMNRHQQGRRSNSNIAPKREPGPGAMATQPSVISPKHRQTPSSHSNSNSPVNAVTSFSPAASDSLSMRGGQRMAMPIPNAGQPKQPPMHNGNGRGPAGAGAAFYPTPAFQNHSEQLEQEYDAQNDMAEDSEMDTPNGSGGPYPPGFAQDGQPAMLSPPASNGNGQPNDSVHPGRTPTSGGQYPSMTQLLDQDWDPFGLSASMAFPAQQFQFDQPMMR